MGTQRRPVPSQPVRGCPGIRKGVLSYVCNICGQPCEAKVVELGRERVSCPCCGSTVRMRAIIHLLSIELFGEGLILPDFPARPRVHGIGLSDWDAYAGPLSERLDYTNTYYHQEPRLDITDVDPALEGTLDFLISTDVFEHVPPPVSTCFVNSYRLLKPGGVLIFSVPYVIEGQTTEHFPDLYKYEIIRSDTRSILRNHARDGREQVFDELVFHGGVGDTLEMRVFSESSLLDEFAKAGFEAVTIHGEPSFDYGIYWWKQWALPMTARKPCS